MAVLGLGISLIGNKDAYAQSIWQAAPVNGNWNNASNWNIVPGTGSVDTSLTFGASSVTALNNNFEGNFTLNSLSLTSAAPAYSLSGGTLSFGKSTTDIAPSILMDTASNVTINSAINYSADLTINGSGNGNLILGGGLSGEEDSALTVNTSGTVTLNGANTLQYYLSARNGTLVVTNGSSLNSGTQEEFIGSAIGTEAGDNATVNIGGGTGNSTWKNSGGVLVVGNDGTGTLNITGGGSVDSHGISMGEDFTGSGTATVGGGSGNSTWTSSSYIFVGTRNTGDLTITGGGSVTNNLGIIGYYASGSGAVEVGGGIGASRWTNNTNLVVGQFGTGELTVTGGGSVSNVIGYIAFDPDSDGVATIGGGTGAATWSSSDNLFIASSGTGTLNIIGGGAVTNEVGIIGDKVGGKGDVNVGGGTGAAVWTNNKHLVVAQFGSGKMNVTGQGTVTNTTGYIAFETGSTGTVEVGGGTGASSWQNSGNLYIATSGTATMTVTGGGTVSNVTGVISDAKAGVGTVNVGGGTGSSAWNNSGLLYLGSRGKGTMNVTGGGSVTSASSILGDSVNSNGTANIGGGTGNSFWNAGSELLVGNFGAGIMNITGGGDVTNTKGYIGSVNGGVGTVTVGSGTGTSTWTNTSDLAVGAGGKGILNINTGGKVVAARLVGGNANSQVNFNGGTMRVTASGSITSTNRFDLQAGGGTIEADAGTHLILQTAVTGSGDLRKAGAGTLTLTASNLYTGGTRIEEGKLLLNNNYALNGALTVEDGGILATRGLSVLRGGVIVESGGRLFPGNEGAAGWLKLDTTLEFQAGSNFDVLINSSGVSGTDYSRLEILGLAELDGFLNVSLDSNFTPLSTDTFVILLSGNNLLGRFTNTPGDILTLAQGTFEVEYNPGSVRLTNFATVPEPSTSLLIAVSLGTMAFTRRRQRA